MELIVGIAFLLGLIFIFYKILRTFLGYISRKSHPTFKAQVVKIQERGFFSTILPNTPRREYNPAVMVTYGFNSAGSEAHDLTLELEYEEVKELLGLLSREELIQKDLIEGLEPMDNIVVEVHKVKGRDIHRIVEVWRGNEIIFSVEKGVEFTNSKKIQKEKEIRDGFVTERATYIERYLSSIQIDEAILTHPYEFKTYVTDPGWKQYRSKFTWVEKEVFGSIHRELDRDAESNWIEVFSHIQKEIVAAKQRHGSLKAGLDEVLKKLPSIVRQVHYPGTVKEESGSLQVSLPISSVKQPSGSIAITMLSRDKRSLVLPDDMERVMNAVVLIRTENGHASGFIVSSDGYILTAAHVVSGVQKVNVELKSGLRLDARVLRVDDNQDIALIKIEGQGHACLPLCLKATTPVGSELYAIGAPLTEELAFSVSKGVISGYREKESDKAKFIQTDVSLNPGNSGGPLLNKNGQCVGIVSWKINIPGFESISFGVPLEIVAECLGIQWIDGKEEASQRYT